MLKRINRPPCFSEPWSTSGRMILLRMQLHHAMCLCKSLQWHAAQSPTVWVLSMAAPPSWSGPVTFLLYLLLLFSVLILLLLASRLLPELIDRIAPWEIWIYYCHNLECSYPGVCGFLLRSLHIVIQMLLCGSSCLKWQIMPHSVLPIPYSCFNILPNVLKKTSITFFPH